MGWREGRGGMGRAVGRVEEVVWEDLSGTVGV